MSEDNPKAETHYGKKVRVVNKLSDRDFTVEAIKTRQPGAGGTIIGHSDSHGLCFKIRHDDGTLSCYDPDELMEATTVYVPFTHTHPLRGVDIGDNYTDCDGCIHHGENDGGDPHCLAFELDLIGIWTVGAGGPIGMRCSGCLKQNAGLSTCQIDARVVDMSSGSAVFMDAP